MKNQKLIVFAALMATTIALVALSAYTLYNSSVYQSITYTSSTYGDYPYGMTSGHMGNMMNNWANISAISGTQNTATAQNAIFPIVGIVTLAGAAVTGSGGIAYFAIKPKIKGTRTTIERLIEQPTEIATTPYASVLKTLIAEERQVLDVLASHGGKYLQKYIRAETGLSRLKTHRIVSRLAERGIVTLEKVGNTNQVYLSTWLNSQIFNNKINLTGNEKNEIEVET